MMEGGFWEGAGLDKLESLKKIIRSYEKVLVAFSGGSDSAFVLKVSRECLGKENAVAVIAKSPSLPESEYEEAKQIAAEIGAELLTVETRELENAD